MPSPPKTIWARYFSATRQPREICGLERRCQVLEEQQKQLMAQVDRREELAGLSRSIEDFCQRIRQGLEQASFEQKRKLVELLIDRVIVTDGDVEIRYVMPTSKSSEHIRFCHLYMDYRTRSPERQTEDEISHGLRLLSHGLAHDPRNRDHAHAPKGTSTACAEGGCDSASSIYSPAVRIAHGTVLLGTAGMSDDYGIGTRGEARGGPRARGYEASNWL